MTAILDRYLSALESGAPPGREELLAAHPDLAGPLRTYLGSLDELHDAAAGFGHPALGASRDADQASSGDEKRLGDFRILREVGRGGMGVVYEAQQISLGRRVALKVLPFAAVLDSKQVTRFKNEAQAAAQLHHPNIVSVYAVGVERGVHYYAMQFIDGQPLDRAIAELRRAAGFVVDAVPDSAPAHGDLEPQRPQPATCRSFLTAHSQKRGDYLATVIRLGIQAAEALHAAHEYGIVHRDIKPSNLILDGDGNLWVTDFGLARCQTDVSLTRTGEVIGTLTGEIGSTAEAIEAHRNALRLSEQLAADHPREADYRRRVAVCRNNLALALRSAGRTDDARRAYQEAIRLQEQLAEDPQNGDRAPSGLALAHNNLGLLESETGHVAQSEAAFREAIRLQEHLLAAQPDNPEHLRNLAASLNNLSTLYVADQPARAAELYQQALAYQTKAAQARPRELKYPGDVALTCNNLGAVQSRAQQFAQAAASYARAIEIQRALVGAAPAQTSYRRDLAVSYNNLGLTESKLGNATRAEGSFQQALELQELLVTQNPHDVDLRSSLGGIYNNLAMVLEELGRPADAAQSCRKAVEHQQSAYSAAPNVSRYRAFLSKHYYNYGRILRSSGRAEEAARVALARRDLWPGDANRLVGVAEELALASKALAGSNVSGGLTAQQCAEHALETLRRALAAGWKPAPDLDRNASFAALKNYPEFAGLVKH